MGFLEMIGLIFATVIAHIIANESRAWCPRCCQALLRCAVQILRRDIRERLHEEWQAVIYHTPGDFSKVVVALNMVLWAIGTRIGTPIEYVSLPGDRAIAVALLFILSPIFLTLTVLVALIIGRPVFYRGERLGRHRDPYMVFKFRTLPNGIQKRLGTSLFSEQEEVLPVLARFMRETGLDELPQIINVARGEMRFFGPRPERREIYERYGCSNADYERRFDTAPGLFGVSQLLTPHSAPKRLRARLDRRYLKSGGRLTWPFFLYAYAATVRQVIVSAGRYFWHNAINLRMARRKREKRSQLRVAPRNATIQLIDPSQTPTVATGYILDMNRDYIRARFDRPLPSSYITTQGGRLLTVRGTATRGRTRTARCHAHIERQLNDGDRRQPEYLIAYNADTPLNRYLVDQYFLEQAIIPRR